MTQFDFDRFVKVLTDLYPKIGDGMNHEQANVWRMAIGSYDADRAISALREWAAFRQRWPRPADLRAFLSSKAVAKATDDRAAEIRRREEIDEDIRRRDETIAEMDDDLIRRHLEAVVARDWRLGFAMKQAKSVADVRKSPGLKSVVALRVWAGIGPDEPGCDEVPERYTGARGNLGGALAKAVGR